MELILSKAQSRAVLELVQARARLDEETRRLLGQTQEMGQAIKETVSAFAYQGGMTGDDWSIQLREGDVVVITQDGKETSPLPGA